MNNLLTFLNTIQPISIELGNAILSSTEREVLPRHHYLLRPGGVARQVYF